jgi:hypothetical protein
MDERRELFTKRVTEYMFSMGIVFSKVGAIQQRFGYASQWHLQKSSADIFPLLSGL